MKPGEEYLFTISEVAELLGVHRHTVATWAKVGRLPVVCTPAGRPRFPESKIYALLERPS
jgi:excisionase family DNA binding protein